MMHSDSELSEQLSMAERMAALIRVGAALMSELDESKLLHMIAETARDLTQASFAAFTLRPVNEKGEPLVPSEGNLFHLAAVVGVPADQEELLSRTPLGGEGLLAPIFRHGVTVNVSDAMAHIAHRESTAHKQSKRARDSAREKAFAYAHGHLPVETLSSVGVPRGHPVVRSFLGVPLLDRDKQVIGGLLLGHVEPGRFTEEDEALLVGLAAQAAVALENAQLYRRAKMHAQELNAIFESIMDGVILVDSEGRILRENSTARRIRELLQCCSDDQQAMETMLHAPARHALNGTLEQGTTASVIDEQGEMRVYNVNASPLHSPEPSSGPLQMDETTQGLEGEQSSVRGAVVVWHDVTEAQRLIVERRVHAETEARRALLQMVLDELPSSVYLVHGTNAQLVLANQASATVWGAHWPVGQPMSDFLKQNGIRIFSVDGRTVTSEHLATLRAVQHKETLHHHQEIIRHADGTTLPVLVNAVALDTAELNISPGKGNVSQETNTDPEPAAIVVHQDVTALKEAERLKDEFIGIAAHELRNPLAILKGFAQTLIVQTARGNGPELADWQLEALQGIDQATSRMVELTEDLLDVTRLQAGRLTLHEEPTDLVALARRGVTRIQMTSDKHLLSIHALVQHCVVYVDPRRMEQVLNNLLGNAIKYSPDGGPIEIKISVDAEGKNALLSVQDYGIGIPAEQQARIFGRFVRADNAQLRGIGGTGLGLYLCRELVEQQGGRIWFESVEGEGATFYVSLPMNVELEE